MLKRYCFYIAAIALNILSVHAQRTNNIRSLPAISPEAMGVSSAGIIGFLNAVHQSSKYELHSFTLLRHGRLIAKGAWKPYRAELKHTLYSTTKCFTSTAVGFAIAEGKLKLSDKAITFFPESLPDTVIVYWQQLTIKHLLTMTGGLDTEPDIITGDNWIKAALACPLTYVPGTRFFYNNTGPFLLSAIVQKVTGKTMFDYLTPRLFKPLGITTADWQMNPQGINLGGWGLRLNTRDMAKLG